MKSSPWAAALRAAAKVEVTKLDPKWLPLLPMPSLSITESSQALGSSRQASKSPFQRCEYSFTPPSERTGRGVQGARRAPEGF